MCHLYEAKYAGIFASGTVVKNVALVYLNLSYYLNAKDEHHLGTKKEKKVRHCIFLNVI